MSYSPDVIMHYGALIHLALLIAIGSLGLSVALLVHAMRAWLVRQPPAPVPWHPRRHIPRNIQRRI